MMGMIGQRRFTFFSGASLVSADETDGFARYWCLHLQAPGIQETEGGPAAVEIRCGLRCMARLG
ncbi:hypothetical protein D3C86_2099140 [compost metagenome]